MYVRLAFAVAAHLEPEILIVDEVLAVGDAEFQKKCLGKIDQVSKTDGRTVLFVSHNMGAINALCNSAILLDKGKIKAMGKTETITGMYFGGGFADGLSIADRIIPVNNPVHYVRCVFPVRPGRPWAAGHACRWSHPCGQP